MTVTTLELERLTVTRGGRPVLRDVSLSIPPGVVTALLGPNGAGKSTIVLTVGGVLRPVSGCITLGDRRLDGRRPEQVRASGVAIVPEGRRILRGLTVGDNLRAAAASLPRTEAEHAIEQALDLFPELRRLLGSKAANLSGGEQQMVALAQALLVSPRFVLIDELSLGLAPLVVRRLVPVIEEIAARGIGVLLIEQFATVALELADRVYLLEGGEIRFRGPALALKERPELLHSAYLSHDLLAAPA